MFSLTLVCLVLCRDRLKKEGPPDGWKDNVKDLVREIVKLTFQYNWFDRERRIFLELERYCDGFGEGYLR